MFFTCQYCSKRLLTEKALSKHFCESKKRALLLKSKMGRNAFFYYSEWRRKKGFKVVDESTFLTSKFFKSFINFIEFCNEKMIPERLGFIDLMVQKDVSPLHWCNDFYYEYYVEKFDNIYSPIKQIEISLEFLNKLREKADCELNEILFNIHPIDLMRLIAKRKISPWLLLFMQSFQKYCKHLDKEQKILMSTIVPISIWQQNFTKNKEAVDKIKKLMKTLNI